MARTGRPRKPTAVKRAQGTLRKHRENPAEWIPPPGDLVCPSWLGPVARSEWDRVAPELVAGGIAAAVDATALASVCVEFETWRRAEEELCDGPLVVTTPNGALQPNPLVTIARQSRAAYMRGAASFGFTPSARSSVNAPPKPTEDPVEEFLFGQQGIRVMDGGKK